jgi:hypothetical protein
MVLFIVRPSWLVFEVECLLDLLLKLGFVFGLEAAVHADHAMSILPACARSLATSARCPAGLAR